MRLPDGTILMHEHAPYDPVKAHEYYMRTRKLHPRAKSTSYTVTTQYGTTEKLSAQEYAKQSAYAAHRVAQIRSRLARLTSELHQRLAAAAQREANANKKPTAADRAKARQESKRYRQTHRQQLAQKRKQSSATSGGGSHNKSHTKNSSSSHTTETVASLRGEISMARSNLKDAVARQRSLAAAKQNG